MCMILMIAIIQGLYIYREDEDEEIESINPKLHIFHDASEHDMYYMNQGDRYLDSLKHSVGIKVAQQEFAQKHVSYSRVMQELFNDPAWVKQNINQSDLNRKLYEMASSIQGTELRGKVSLYDLFTEEELYQNWLNANIWWQMAYGNSPYTGNVQPFSQRNLLRNIIQKADSCIALPHPGATLRYGHDTMVTPLTCLLDLNGYGEARALKKTPSRASRRICRLRQKGAENVSAPFSVSSLDFIRHFITI